MLACMHVFLCAITVFIFYTARLDFIVLKIHSYRLLFRQFCPLGNVKLLNNVIATSFWRRVPAVYHHIGSIVRLTSIIYYRLFFNTGLWYWKRNRNDYVESWARRKRDTNLMWRESAIQKTKNWRKFTKGLCNCEVDLYIFTRCSLIGTYLWYQENNFILPENISTEK